MGTQKPVQSLATSNGSLDLFLTHLHLLELDRLEGWPDISAQVLTSKDAGPNQKARIHAVEWSLYKLFETWDADETSDKLRPFFPAFEPLQSANLRAALFRLLNKLKSDGTLPKETIVRKSSFDDCKGEKFAELLLAFSSLVLRKFVSARPEGRDSIVKKACAKSNITSKTRQSFLPLALAHRSALRGVLQRKDELRRRYQEFGQVLDVKHRDLDRKFSRIVDTQTFLDKNIAPEATVSRVAKQFEEQWRGNTGYVDAVITSRGPSVTDALLDESFHDIWPNITNGTFVADLSVSRSGLLEDLEKRISAQTERVQQWKDYRAEMQENMKPTSSTRVQESSPSRTRNTIGSQRREKDLVFSPRKSPRKSVFPATKLPSSPSSTRSPTSVSTERSQPALSNVENGKSPGSSSKADFLKRRDSCVDSAINDSRVNDSSFSEIGQDVTTQFNTANAAQSSPLAHRETEVKQSTTYQPEANPLCSDSPQSPLMALHGNNAQGEPQETLNEEQQAADRIVSQTLNAAPTPAKAPLSLLERTQQSMQIVTPSTRLASHESPHKMMPLIYPAALDPEDNDMPPPPANLVERTRQSISLVPPKPKPSRRSTNTRRDSKTYPINQFETPGRGLARELTPPQEIFSPAAGYDSVFKSRPKVGFSPSATPEPASGDGGTGDGDFEVDQGGIGGDSLQASPLARLTTQV